MTFHRHILAFTDTAPTLTACPVCKQAAKTSGCGYSSGQMSGTTHVEYYGECRKPVKKTN